MAVAGLTSVTFRELSAAEVLCLAKEAGLAGLEWGGDIHLPPERPELAEELARRTAQAGLRSLSYGSYHRLCQGMDFQPVLKAAARLGAPNIRIWAGDRSPAQADAAYRAQAARELEALCRQAAGEGIRISLEYHRQTLTETLESALELLKQAGAENLRSYWQPNPDLSHEANCRELEGIRPWLSGVHVFQWEPGNIRHPLEEGRPQWSEYVSLAGRDCPYLLEFVKDDSPEQLLRDASALLELLA